MRRRGHPPKRIAICIHGVVTFRLRLDHVRSERGVPEDLLCHVALAQCWQRLIEVIGCRAWRGIGPKPLIPLADSIDGRGAVGSPSTRHRGARRVARASFHPNAPFVDRHTIGLTHVAGTGHGKPCISHPPTEIRRALAVVHVAIDAHTIDFLDVVREELCDIFIGRPVNRHAQFIAVLLKECGFVVLVVKPVFAEPVKVSELLVGQLIKIAVRTSCELDAHKIIEIERWGCRSRPVSSHHFGQIVSQLQARVRTD